MYHKWRDIKRVKLWLDDVRRPPDDSWIHVLTSAGAIAMLKASNVTHLSLDHDLGILDLEMYSLADSDRKAQEYEDTGYRVVCWMEENCVWPEHIALHTSNPAGEQRMRLAILASGRYRYGHSRVQFVRKAEPVPQDRRADPPDTEGC